MIKSKEELELFPDNSIAILKRSMIDKYMDRPTSLKTVCPAQFA